MWAGGDRILRVSLRAESAGDQQVLTLHYRCHDIVPNDNSGQSLADAFRDAVITPLKALYISAWTIDPVQVVEEVDPLDPGAARSAWASGAPVAGTRPAQSDYEPSAVCTVVKLTSDKIGRRATGRMFVGGSIGEVDVTNGVFQVTRISLVQALLDAIPRQPDISPAGSASTANWCVYSRTARAQSQESYAFDIGGTVIRTPVRWLRSRQV